MAVRQTQQDDLYADAAMVRTGAEVCARDDEGLGFVSEVWAYIPPYGYIAKSQFHIADYGPVRGTTHLFEGADGYLQVAPGRGVRPESERHLYIPLASIQDMVQDETLIVDHGREACQDRFTGRPECLDGQRTGR